MRFAKYLVLLAVFAFRPSGLYEEYASQNIDIPILPEGKYAFLRAPTLDAEAEKAAVRGLPYESIQLEVTVPQSALSNELGPSYAVLLKCDGSAEYTGDQLPRLNGKYSGSVEIQDFARISMLIETLDSDVEGFQLGRIPHCGHGIFGRLVVARRKVDAGEKDEILTRINEMAFGDFRFWVVEAVVNSVCQRIEWKRIDQ